MTATEHDSCPGAAVRPRPQAPWVRGFLRVSCLLVVLGSSLPAARADWPRVFDLFHVLTLQLQLDPGDWSTVRNDTSLSIEVPGTMWADQEQPISVRVRRKSGPALTAGGVTKVALKVDINDLLPGQTWRGLKKLSLESGAEISVLREGFAWNLFWLASEQGVYGYPAGHASRVRVIVNGDYQGVHVNAEQRDKQFLENRGVDKEGATWLYKIDGGPTIKAGITSGNSPAFEHLCYSPFVAGPGSGQPCPQPNLEPVLAPVLAEDPNAVNDFADLVAIALGGAWKYDGHGCDLGTTWRASAYVDSRWRSGRAPLGDGWPGL